MKVDVKEVKTVQIISCEKNFLGDTRQWQEAYFKLLEWKNTFSTVYDLDINYNCLSGTFVRVTLRMPETVDSVVEMMKELGYRGFNTRNVTIGLTDCWSFDLIVV